MAVLVQYWWNFSNVSPLLFDHIKNVKNSKLISVSFQLGRTLAFFSSTRQPNKLNLKSGRLLISVILHIVKSFPLSISKSMWKYLQFPTGLLTLAKQVLYGKHSFFVDWPFFKWTIVSKKSPPQSFTRINLK